MNCGLSAGKISYKRKILREHTLDVNIKENSQENLCVLTKICSDLYGDIKLTQMSVMPCRLNGDVHEWFNEVVTVPS